MLVDIHVKYQAWAFMENYHWQSFPFFCITEVRNAHLRRNMDVTIRTINLIKKSPLSRICDKEIEDLENFRMELERLDRFPQEPPTLHWALVEFAYSPVVSDEVVNTVRSFLLLLGEPIQSLQVSTKNTSLKTDMYISWVYKLNVMWG